MFCTEQKSSCFSARNTLLIKNKAAEALKPQDLCLFKTNIAVSQYLQHSLINASTQLHGWITGAGSALHGNFDPVLLKVHKIHRESEF